MIDIEAVNAKVVEALATGRYAFIDAGCGSGGSIDLCQRRFGMSPGLGLDFYPPDLEMARAAGYEALFCNVLMDGLVFPENCVTYSSMVDTLEHMPTEADAVKLLQKLERASRDFLFIRHPSFEDTEYLASLGLKLNWTDWSGHTNMMTLEDLKRIFADFGWTDVTIVPHMLYTDSRHSSVLPLGTPTDTMTHDPDLHGPKPIVEFDRPVYGKFDIFIRFGGIDDETWAKMTSVAGWEAGWEE